MAIRKLPAAAIPVGSEVVEPETGKTITIKNIYNSTPRPGLITWIDENLLDWEIKGNEKIEIISLP